MQARNTVQADYLVVTALLSGIRDEDLDNFARLTIEGEFRRFYGYRGFVKDKLYVGDNGERILIQATGAKANEVLTLVNTGWPGLSMARLDLQLTVLVPDADSVVRGTVPHSAYKAVRMLNLNERGATLYVGSAKSRCRLRMYNKTAESGEDRVAGQEKLRIELQLRDDYADRALINMNAGTGDMFFRHYVLRMTDGYITNLVDKAFANSNLLAMTEVDTENTVDTRKAWLEHSVIPALSRLAVYDPAYYKEFLEKLKDLID